MMSRSRPAFRSVLFAFLLLPPRTIALAVARPTMSSTPPAKTVAVVGATGRLGRNAVLKLNKDNVPVRCLLRRRIDESVQPSIDKGASSAEVAAYLASLPNVEMVVGDITDRGSLDKLVEGCSAVLALHGAKPTKPAYKSLIPLINPESDPSHSKQINYVGVRNLIDACVHSGTVKRIVRVTGKGEDPWGIFSILINMLGSMAKAWNYEGEQLLRTNNDNDVDYTIVRPGVMGRDDIPSGPVLALADNGGDLKVSAVRYEDIASLCVECLDYPNAARSTLTAMNVEPGEGEETYAPLLAKVSQDTREFPASLMDEHRKAARTGAAVLFGFLALFVQGVLVPGAKLVAGLLRIGK